MIVKFNRNGLELITESELEVAFVENTLKMWSAGSTIVLKRTSDHDDKIVLESDNDYEAVLK